MIGQGVLLGSKMSVIPDALKDLFEEVALTEEAAQHGRQRTPWTFPRTLHICTRGKRQLASEKVKSELIVIISPRKKWVLTTFACGWLVAPRPSHHPSHDTPRKGEDRLEDRYEDRPEDWREMHRLIGESGRPVELLGRRVRF
jgi:hypothetical protein